MAVTWQEQKQDHLALLRAEVAQGADYIAQALCWVDRGVGRPYRVRVSVVFVGRPRWQREKGYLQPSPAMQAYNRLKEAAEAKIEGRTEEDW